MEVFIVLLIAGGLACIPASWAKSKGYSFAAFWCLSFFLSFLIGIIVTACLVDKNEYVRRDELEAAFNRRPEKNCIKCGKPMYDEDRYCPKCGADQDAEIPAQTSKPPVASNAENVYHIRDLQAATEDCIICPVCKTVQRSNRNVCFKCEARFIRD